MGTVYLALDQTLDIQVAVKENQNVDPVTERQFRREASLLATLRHPNLPRVTDHFILDGRQYLVMDYIEGEDLETLCARQPPAVDEVLSWSDEICDALIFLHSREPPVIHRDIKPANIKLQPDGNLVLVDFGIAKVFDSKQTTTGARGLTPGYSPPEQYGGSLTDHRSDQYSLAATLYNMFTGQRPIDSIERMFNKQPLPTVRELNPEVPAHVNDAITRALSLDPDHRFPDIVHFKSALRDPNQQMTVRAATPIQAPFPPSSSVPTQIEVPLQPSRKRTGLWIALAIVAIIIVATGAGAVIIGGGILDSGSSQSPSPTVPVVALVPSDTPTATLTEEALPSPTAEPTETLVPEPTPTPTIEPTSTPLPIGGGGLIAFSSDRGEGANLQIWAMDPDGSNPHQLTFGPGNKTQPRWSPDGNRIAYVSDDNGNEEIYIMNVDGSQLVNVTNHQSDDFDPAWSPDGRTLAFTTKRVNDLEQVFLMDLSCPSLEEECVGSNPRNLTVGYAVEFSSVWGPEGVSMPDWMPSQPIAVVASINGAPGRLFFRASGGGDPDWYDVQDELIGVDHIDWSPDGQFMIFTWKQPGQFEIYALPIADRGRNWIKLTSSLGNREPTFSPDGQFIALTSTRDQNFEIYRMSVSGADQVNLTNNSARDMNPDWQPPPSN